MITNYTAKKILDAMCIKTKDFNLADYIYLGLSKTPPNRAGEGVTEPTAPSYSRVLICSDEAQAMGDVDENMIANATEIRFPAAAEDWADETSPLRYACFYTAQSGGELIAWGELGERKNGQWEEKDLVPLAENVVVFEIGDLRISIE